MVKSISLMPVLRRVRLPAAAALLAALLVGLALAGAKPLSAEGGDSMKLLAVPYIDQGQTRWCFQTALSMVLQYNGIDVTPGDIARANDQSVNQATSIIDVFFGWVGGYLQQWPDLSLHRSLSDWSFEQFRSVLSNGRGEPIIVSTFGIPGHTVVVVGYSTENGKDYIYLHDPSGYLTEYRWNTGARTYAKVDWDTFNRYYWTKVFVTMPQAGAPFTIQLPTPTR